ncbi:hypothetical protein IEQ34_014819 [Dendrobium chrysotoxum]|uniref:Uncharacterized protein n=1 Tax=Dendrobium chrysotoxum TaxID=161865 RepID=A0AAV7GKZ1_DENCH|nr:hypothetical protein IEQ34_014819 [Dendrobium chrysotoxum]
MPQCCRVETTNSRAPQCSRFGAAVLCDATALHDMAAMRNIKWSNHLKLNTRKHEQFYHLHRSCGHATEACKQLKEEIYRLI